MMAFKQYIPKTIKNYIKNSLVYARIRVNLLNRPIKVWFFREPDLLNFGDEITPDIIERIFHKKCIRVEINEAELFAVGSIIEVINHKRNKKSYVWGTGFISEGSSIENKKLVFRAVRGQLSRMRLPKQYHNIVLGDPGLLSSLMYTDLDEKTDSIGIVPHYVDCEEKMLEKAKKDSRYKLISVKDTPENVAKQIASCKVILSSSLHGLIVADSFNVPNIHMPISSKVVGENYKFKDYYSSIRKDYKKFNKQNIYNIDEVKKVIDNYQPINNLEELQKSLIKAFPF